MIVRRDEPSWLRWGLEKIAEFHTFDPFDDCVECMPAAARFTDAEFERWFAAEIAKAQVGALQSASEDIELSPPWDHHGNIGPNAIQYDAEAEASTWLEVRAAAIREGHS